MSQVSVADVDNLSDVYSGLVESYSIAQTSFEKDAGELTAIQEAAENDYAEASSALEAANELVDQCQQELEQLQSALEEAEAELASAEEDLAEAESGGSYDEDGNWEPADTSGEEAAVEEAQEHVAEINEQINAAQEKMEKAQEQQQKCAERAELAKETLQIASQHMESFVSAQTVHLSAIEHQVSVAQARLNHAREALSQYLATNPQAASFEKWVHWQPAKGQIITPDIIHDRLNLSSEQSQLFAEYLYARDSAFRNRIDEYRSKYNAAQGQAEKHAILVQASRGGSGDFAEKLAVYAFKPFGTVSTQDRRFFEDGKYTKIDLRVSDLNRAVILGRGEKMGAPAGGSLAIEIKTGHPEYLYSQKDHLIFQAGGHQDSSASMVICSRDIHDLSPEKEKELRDALRSAGSPIIGMMPSKDELDGTIWKQVCETMETKQ